MTRIADLAPLVLPHDVALASAVERALERDAASVYDEVIIVDGQGYYLGYCSVRELVQEQGAALERTALEREARWHARATWRRSTRSGPSSSRTPPTSSGLR